MTRRVVISSAILFFAVIIVAFVWVNSGQSLEVNTSLDADAVREVIQRSQKVNAEAEYSFNTDILATVYTNDPRGGWEVKPETLALIREMRQDPTLKVNQVGLLDGKQASIWRRKQKYQDYIDGLQQKEMAGTLTIDEREILNYVRTGVFTPIEEPTPDMSVFLLTPPAAEVVESVTPIGYPLPVVPIYAPPTPTLPPYPVPEHTPVVDGQMNNSVEDERWFVVPFRGPNPEIMLPYDFKINILSVKIDGDIATAIVSRSGITAEQVLVKVDEKWYIAGSKLLKFSAP